MKKTIIDKQVSKNVKYEIEDIICYNGEIYLKIAESDTRFKWIKFSTATSHYDELKKGGVI